MRIEDNRRDNKSIMFNNLEVGRVFEHVELNMIMNLFGTQHDEDCIDEPDGSGVRLSPITDDGYFLEYDNSANEYADGYFQIHYCPICGRKLEAQE